MKVVQTGTERTSVSPSTAAELPSSRSPFLNSVWPYLVVAVLSAVIVACILRVWKLDLTVPIGTDPDAYFHQMVVKNFVEGGHFYVNPWVGAPGELKLYDFPLPHWIHLGVWEVLRLFSHNYGFVLNLFYFLTFPFCALTALYAFRRFGISRGLAMAGALLYALMPFHLYRSESHLFLSCLYTLPMGCLVMLWVAIGNPLFRFELPRDASSRPVITRDGWIALASCVAVAWDHPYYAFFTVGFLVIAGLLGRFRNGHSKALLSAIILCAVLTSALLVALSPNLIYFHKHGRTLVAQRDPGETEIGPVKLIMLIMPLRYHRVPVLAHFTDRYLAQAPKLLVNENFTQTLGTLASIGLFVSLASFFRRRVSDFLYSLGILNLWAVLFGTVGGFGTIFAFLVSPQVRALNRISVFISFFSTAALIWALDRWLASRSAGLVACLLVPSLLVAIALFDQIPRHRMTDRSLDEAEFKRHAAYIAQIEHSLTPGSMIFQLPYMCFPECGSVNKMLDYDQFVGYLHSKNLRWSYGAMRGRPIDQWQAGVAAEPPDQMVSTVRDAGFSGIFIDRFGYADNGGAIEAQLRTLLKSEPIADSQGRYLFFRLAPKTASP